MFHVLYPYEPIVAGDVLNVLEVNVTDGSLASVNVIEAFSYLLSSNATYKFPESAGFSVAAEETRYIFEQSQVFEFWIHDPSAQSYEQVPDVSALTQVPSLDPVEAAATSQVPSMVDAGQSWLHDSVTAPHDPFVHSEEHVPEYPLTHCPLVCPEIVPDKAQFPTVVAEHAFATQFPPTQDSPTSQSASSILLPTQVAPPQLGAGFVHVRYRARS